MTSSRGFTLVEMLVALVIFSILAAMSVRLGSSKEAASLAVMRSDLRNLASAQESYFADYEYYADDVANLEFEASEETTVVLRGDRNGWSGRTEHSLRPEYRCAIYIGDINALAPAVEEGLMVCEPKATGGGCSGGG